MTEQKRTHHRLRVTDKKDFALAVCMGEENLSSKFGYKPSTVNNYISYAKGSASNRTVANYTYRGQDKVIRHWIDVHIDEGRHCDLQYRALEKTGPSKNRKHKKEESPAKATQMKLEFTEPTQVLPSKNDTELINLMSKALSTISDLCRAIEVLKRS